jgi:hypothetical protein
MSAERHSSNGDRPPDADICIDGKGSTVAEQIGGSIEESTVRLKE